MAFQTEPHPSSTAASAPSNTPTDDNSDPGFSLSASPPLILAFLAVGMFAISMVVFFGWRRMTAGRRVWVAPEVGSVAATPKLWDVWSPRERDDAIAVTWCNIQPLAATVWDDTPPIHVPATNDTHRNHSLAAAALAHLRRRYRRRPPQEDIAIEAKLPTAASLVRLQIAVTIAMPTPDSPSNPSWTESDEEPLDYSIGLYEMPWKKTH
ncbi:hypothetical protein B0H19DRAFT_1057763 [Mycena capillaripes]|nr:hypothetical protein B0H19DRAFT_1057763 [Mycena capillaripes]